MPSPTSSLWRTLWLPVVVIIIHNSLFYVNNLLGAMDTTWQYPSPHSIYKENQHRYPPLPNDYSLYATSHKVKMPVAVGQLHRLPSHAHYATCYSTSPISMGKPHLRGCIIITDKHIFAPSLTKRSHTERIQSLSPAPLFRLFPKLRIFAHPLWSSLSARRYRTLWRKSCILTHMRRIYHGSFI